MNLGWGPSYVEFQNAGANRSRISSTVDNEIKFEGTNGGTAALLQNVATPITDSDAATKQYVDLFVQGLHWKPAVRVATTAAGTLGTSFANGQTVDGVALVTGNRILIKDQADGVENGIYTVNAAGAPTRATDMANASDASSVAVFVETGTTNSDSGFVCTNDSGSAVVGTDALVFSLFSTAGSTIAGGIDTEMQFNNAGTLDGVSTFTTDGTNLTLNGGDMRLREADGLRFGDTDDLNVIRSVGNSYITNTSGDLIISNLGATDSIKTTLGSITDTTSYLIRDLGGNTLFEVKGDKQADFTGNLDVSGGIDIDADNASLTIGANSDLIVVHDGTDTVCTSKTGNLVLDNTNTTGASVVRLGSDNVLTSLQVRNNSDTALFTVKGDGSGLLSGHLDVTGGIDIPLDNQPLRLGIDSDFQIVHNGTNSLITSTTGNLLIDNSNATGHTEFKLGSDTDATSFSVVNDTGTIKMQVEGDGQVTMTGNLQVFQGIDITQDNQLLRLGSGSDLQLSHTGGDSFITSTTGDLIIANTNATGATINRLGSDDLNSNFEVTNSSGGSLLKITADGPAVFTGNVSAVSYTSTSDATLKHDIEKIESPLDKIDSINAFQYRFNFVEDDKLRYGVMAQELEANGLGNLVDQDSQGRKAVDYNNLVGLLIGSVKELKREVEALKMV